MKHVINGCTNDCKRSLLKTRSDIRCELLVLNKVTKNEGSCSEADWRQEP